MSKADVLQELYDSAVLSGLHPREGVIILPDGQELLMGYLYYMIKYEKLKEEKK